MVEVIACKIKQMLQKIRSNLYHKDDGEPQALYTIIYGSLEYEYTGIPFMIRTVKAKNRNKRKIFNNFRTKKQQEPSVKEITNWNFHDQFFGQQILEF